MNTNQRHCNAEEPTQQPQAESHHGDLRKCAYLKRRAAYQLQASSTVTAQAGAMTASATALPRKTGTD